MNILKHEIKEVSPQEKSYLEIAIRKDQAGLNLKLFANVLAQDVDWIFEVSYHIAST